MNRAERLILKKSGQFWPLFLCRCLADIHQTLVDTLALKIKTTI